MEEEGRTGSFRRYSHVSGYYIWYTQLVYIMKLLLFISQTVCGIACLYIYSGLQGYCKFVMLCVHALRVKFAMVHGIGLLANADY